MPFFILSALKSAQQSLCHPGNQPSMALDILSYMHNIAIPTKDLGSGWEGWVTVLGVICPFLYVTFRHNRANNGSRQYVWCRHGPYISHIMPARCGQITPSTVTHPWNWNRTIVIGIGIKAAGICPSLVRMLQLQWPALKKNNFHVSIGYSIDRVAPMTDCMDQGKYVPAGPYNFLGCTQSVKQV